MSDVVPVAFAKNVEVDGVDMGYFSQRPDLFVGIPRRTYFIEKTAAAQAILAAMWASGREVCAAVVAALRRTYGYNLRLGGMKGLALPVAIGLLPMLLPTPDQLAACTEEQKAQWRTFFENTGLRREDLTAARHLSPAAQRERLRELTLRLGDIAGLGPAARLARIINRIATALVNYGIIPSLAVALDHPITKMAAGETARIADMLLELVEGGQLPHRSASDCWRLADLVRVLLLECADKGVFHLGIPDLGMLLTVPDFFVPQAERTAFEEALFGRAPAPSGGGCLPAQAGSGSAQAGGGGAGGAAFGRTYGSPASGHYGSSQGHVGRQRYEPEEAFPSKRRDNGRDKVAYLLEKEGKLYRAVARAIAFGPNFKSLKGLDELAGVIRDCRASGLAADAPVPQGLLFDDWPEKDRCLCCGGTTHKLDECLDAARLPEAMQDELRRLQH